MSYDSDVAFSFTKENWRELLDQIEQKGGEFQKEADWLLKSANINQDYLDGEHHVVYWHNVQWQEYDPDSIGVVKFFESIRQELSDEYMRVGENSGDFEYDSPESDDGIFMRDGDKIQVLGIALADYERKELLEKAVKAFVKADPEAARMFHKENEKRYGCDEFDELFEEA